MKHSLKSTGTEDLSAQVTAEATLSWSESSLVLPYTDISALIFDGTLWKQPCALSLLYLLRN